MIPSSLVPPPPDEVGGRAVDEVLGQAKDLETGGPETPRHETTEGLQTATMEFPMNRPLILQLQLPSSLYLMMLKMTFSRAPDVGTRGSRRLTKRRGHICNISSASPSRQGAMRSHIFPRNYQLSICRKAQRPQHLQFLHPEHAQGPECNNTKLESILEEGVNHDFIVSFRGNRET